MHIDAQTDSIIADSTIDNRQSAIGNPVPWAIYLGMSWTWVIGMFLPVLLVRDYGAWAWVIFAIPNCLGAAAMGWVMRSGAQSRRLIETHAVACRVFSLVTIAFHLFFAIWMLPQLVGNAAWIVTAAVVQLCFTPLSGRRNGPLAAAGGTLIVSLVIALLLLWQGALAMPAVKPLAFPQVAGLGLVCLLGFIACPYLDLTFHQARQSTGDRGAKIAFGFGFCLFFASMIVLTLLYADYLQSPALQSPAAWLLFIHLSVQICLTVTLHAGAAREQAQARDDVPNYRAALGLALAIGLAGGLASGYAARNDIFYAGLTVGEVIYRGFMGFYGLLFPAYLACGMLPGRANWPATIVTVLLALPFYWLGFVERKIEWIAAGVGVVVAAGLLTNLRKRNRRSNGQVTKLCDHPGHEAASPRSH